MMKKHLTIMLLCAALLGCGASSCSKDKPKSAPVEKEANEPECSCPHCHILIQPYGNFSQARAKEVAKNLEKNLQQHANDLVVTKVDILPNQPLTEDLMNKAKTRYRASKILDRQSSSVHEPDEAIIGLTDSDISTTAHGHEDWGILGLSNINKGNCVISTFRVKDKSQLWKVVLHEFGHAFLGLPHCPNNDPTCFMVDANGKPDLAKENRFCPTCAKSIP
jgi:archaemetzincin